MDKNCSNNAIASTQKSISGGNSTQSDVSYKRMLQQFIAGGGAGKM